MKILVTGGGTGGHIYPALSLINEIRNKQKDVEFLYIGTSKGLESQIVPSKGIPFETIEIQGLKRSLSFDNVKTFYLFMKSLSEAKKIIKKFQPDIVLGTGGYVCAPMVYKASKMGIPTIIHEQNSVPGVTNKFLAKYVDKVCVCFPEAKSYFPQEKVVMTGNPRAQEVANVSPSDILNRYGLDPTKPTVLIFGGSRGAQTINQAFIEAYEKFQGKDYQVLYGSGKIYYPGLMDELSSKPSLPNVSIQEYIDEMEKVLVNIDLIVGRAGATSLAEITALGIPSILIPSPNVTNDHQTKNAQSLVDSHAAKLIKDDEFTGTSLVDMIDKIMLDDSLRNQMKNSSKSQGMPHAADDIYHLMKSL